MSSTNPGGTATAAAAAEQLGSMAIGGSGEREGNNEKNEDAEENNGNRTPTKMCSTCETKSGALKKCNGCKCVWYCDKDCQNKHRKEHRKECKVIMNILDQRGGKLDVGTEKDICPLGKLPPREECPICMRALPFHEGLHSYASCCGKTLCGGCSLEHQVKSRRQRAGEGGQTTVRPTCAFCRSAVPKSEAEYLVNLRKRVELKDPDALCSIALKYGYGRFGLSVDQRKCIELLRESASLGFPAAHYQLGAFYFCGHMGLEQNEEEALKYYQQAAESGDVAARHNLGGIEFRSDNLAAMRHWRLAASGGFKKSMGALIEYFEDGLLRHGNLAETLQAFNNARAEMKSKDRDQYIKHLKETGESCEEFDL